ncbi:MAG TPA: metalloregulator ArsR/SmtB family transcription factor [Candidatus Woesebacteria bacterium]|nr:metalloregulator ArsR/SmtB family transcription factor [Candidatus Woesebacteria bacterium]
MLLDKLFELETKVLRALANPRRLEIIHLIRDQELSVSEIFSMLDLPQANVSQHLTVLRQAGLVATRRVGQQVMYRLTHPNLINASDLLRQMLAEQTSVRDEQLNKLLKQKSSDLIPVFTDPVCGMKVTPATAGFSRRHQGQNYFFCASGCYKHFIENPEKYAK